jgi:hypothetical protein
MAIERERCRLAIENWKIVDWKMESSSGKKKLEKRYDLISYFLFPIS